jgi:lipid A 3-O-deacylase
MLRRCLFFFTLSCWLSCSGVAACARNSPRGTLILNSGVSGVFDPERNPVFSLEYRFGEEWRGLRPWCGLGWATDGAIFAGFGAVKTWITDDETWAVSIGFGPGFYERHEGRDLGSHLEFCSYAEVSRELPWHDHRAQLRLSHVSNGGVKELNPGTELLTLGYAMPLP